MSHPQARGILNIFPARESYLKSSMNKPIVDAILRTWDRQRDYAVRLVADLSQSDMVSQPVPGVVMNHPAWIFSHIGLYPPVLAAILREESFVDPINSPFGKDSKPLSDAGAYADKATLMDAYFRGHDELAETLMRADLNVLAKPIPLARWKERFPFIADVIVHLMVNHEAGHLGQVSAWRRAGKRPSV
jgi:hypothetical protein